MSLQNDNLPKFGRCGGAYTHAPHLSAASASPCGSPRDRRQKNYSTSRDFTAPSVIPLHLHHLLHLRQSTPCASHTHLTSIATRQDGCLGFLYRQEVVAARVRIIRNHPPRHSSFILVRESNDRRCIILHEPTWRLRSCRAASSRRPQPRHPRLPHPRRLCTFRPPRQPVHPSITRMV